MTKGESSVQKSIVAILVALIGCVGAVLAALIGAPWLKDVIIGPDPTLTFQQSVETAVVATAMAENQSTEPVVPDAVIQPTDVPTVVAMQLSDVLPTATLRPSPTPFYDLNLLYNGDFTNGTDGWERMLADEGGSGKIKLDTFQSTYSGKGMSISQTGKGAVGLTQVVPIESTDLWFIATFRMTNKDTQLLLTGSAGCGLGLAYGHILDSGDIEWVGASYWLNYDISMLQSIGPMGMTIQDSNAVHYMDVENGSAYISQKFNIQDEIQANLLSLSPNDITHIQVEMFCRSTTNYDATVSIMAGDLALAYAR